MLLSSLTNLQWLEGGGGMMMDRLGVGNQNTTSCTPGPDYLQKMFQVGEKKKKKSDSASWWVVVFLSDSWEYPHPPSKKKMRVGVKNSWTLTPESTQADREGKWYWSDTTVCDN